MNVENVMTRAPKTCSPSDRISYAVQLMWDNDFGCVPIVDGNGRLAGIVTDRDACMASLMLGRALHEIPIEQAMSRNLFTIAPHDPVQNAISLFLEHNVRRVPVVDGRGALVGILSIADLVCASAEKRIGKHTKPEAVLSAVHAVSKPRSAKSKAESSPAQASASDTIIPQPRTGLPAAPGATKSTTSSQGGSERQPESKSKAAKRR